LSKLILVTNPGSSSRKYALYRGEECVATLHFEYEDNKVICTTRFGEEKIESKPRIKDVSEAAGQCESILRKTGALREGQKIDAVAARLVVASPYFGRDYIVDEAVLAEAEKAKDRSPLHTATNLAEIQFFKQKFPNLPVVAISDSAFHFSKPKEAFRYGLDTELQDKIGLGRYGYHGISMNSIVNIMRRNSILPEKVVVCHLGSGASVSAIKNGESVDNSMGYSPLEGMMMATRSGDIDFSAALAIKRELKLDDAGLEQYLNKQAGLLGVSGRSDDIRLLLADEAAGNERAAEAMQTYIYRLRKVIGEMVAVLDGVDAIVFTATVGERSAEIRKRLCAGLTYLDMELDEEKNQNADEAPIWINLAKRSSKPIYMIRTDESREMARRAEHMLFSLNSQETEASKTKTVK